MRHENFQGVLKNRANRECNWEEMWIREHDLVGPRARDERDKQDLVSLSLGEGLICFSCN